MCLLSIVDVLEAEVQRFLWGASSEASRAHFCGSARKTKQAKRAAGFIPAGRSAQDQRAHPTAGIKPDKPRHCLLGAVCTVLWTLGLVLRANDQRGTTSMGSA